MISLVASKEPTEGSTVLIITAPGVPYCICIVRLPPAFPTRLPDKDMSISVTTETGEFSKLLNIQYIIYSTWTTGAFQSCTSRLWRCQSDPQVVRAPHLVFSLNSLRMFFYDIQFSLLQLALRSELRLTHLYRDEAVTLWLVGEPTKCLGIHLSKFLSLFYSWPLVP